MGLPWRWVLPLPDGTIAAADRQNVAYMYSGILADVPAVDPPGVILRTVHLRFTDPVAVTLTYNDPSTTHLRFTDPGTVTVEAP